MQRKSMELVGFEVSFQQLYHIDLDIACDLEKLAVVVGSNPTLSISFCVGNTVLNYARFR